MKKIYFSYSSKLTFDDYVREHSVALRCIPPQTEAQNIVSCKLEVTPFTELCQTVDAFGNNVSTAYIKKEHRFIDFDVNGCAEIDYAKKRTDFMPCYRYFSELTKPDDALRIFLSGVDCAGKSPIEAAEKLSLALSEVMRYEKNTTTIRTTAAEAFAQKTGVCQDFSHVIISLLRLMDIPCRYIAGLASCDGETHAWVEVWNGECWEGYDPTNCCFVSDDYLVLSQGRDYGDCAIDRGVMKGGFTRQMQLVNSRVN